MHDEFTVLSYFAGGIILLACFLAGIIAYNTMLTPIEYYSGDLIDVQYSQSGYGSSDIMVFYFGDGKVIRFSNPVGEIQLGECSVSYRGTDSMKYFVSIEYLEEV